MPYTDTVNKFQVYFPSSESATYQLIIPGDDVTRAWEDMHDPRDAVQKLLDTYPYLYHDRDHFMVLRNGARLTRVNVRYVPKRVIEAHLEVVR